MEEFDYKTYAVLRKKGYELEKEIGRGTFGRVFKGYKYSKGSKMDLKPTSSRLKAKNKAKSKVKSYEGRKIIVAVKMITLDAMSDYVRQYYLPRELEALILIHHKYVVRLYDIMRVDNKLFIAMEFAGNGDLAYYVSANGKLPEAKASKWFGQTTQALAFVHQEYRIAHR